MQQSSKNQRLIRADAAEVYDAFVNPQALVLWQAPGNMTAKIHHFRPEVGGSYQMSLYYSDGYPHMKGKTAEKEDRYTARFIELDPGKRIVTAIQFASSNPAFAGEMTMEVLLETVQAGTLVTIGFKNIPPGIRPEDNKKGTESSLDKLAAYVEARGKLM